MAMKYLKVSRWFFFLIISAFSVIVSNKKPINRLFKIFFALLPNIGLISHWTNQTVEIWWRNMYKVWYKTNRQYCSKSTIWTLNNIESQKYPTWNLILSLWWYMWKSKIKFQNFVPRTPGPEMSWNFFADCDESRLFTLAIVLYQQL